MNQLTCEMCNSTDFLKDGGVFVCQSCGCKYSVEEAKRMMSGEAAPVSAPSVKVAMDTSDELANLYQLARRAKDEDNSENAAKYYEMILVKDPTSWEASFYSIYYTAMSCKIAQIYSAAVSVANCLKSVFGLIRDHVAEEEQFDAVEEVTRRSEKIALMLWYGAKNHYDGIDSSIRDRYITEKNNNTNAALEILVSCGDLIGAYFGEKTDLVAWATHAWIEAKNLIENMYWANYNVDEIVERIGKFDAQYKTNYYEAKKREAEEDERRRKRAALEKEVQTLRNTISNTKTEGISKLGVVLAVLGVILAMSGIVVNGIALAAVGVARIVVQKKKLKKNREEIIPELQAKLAEKEKELNKKD